MRPVQRCLSIVALSVCAGMAQAAPIAISNHSFEGAPGPAPAGGFPLGTPTGWTLHDPNLIINGSGNSVGAVNPTGTTWYTAPNAVPDGTSAALIFLSGPANQRGMAVGLEQTLAVTLQANTQYTLIVEVGNIATGTGLGSFAGFGFINLNGFPGYQVQLLAGGTVIDQDDDSLTGLIPEGQFRTSTVEFSTGAAHALLGQSLGIRLVNLNNPGIEVNFDNVRLDATPVRQAPLPGMAALLGLGLAALAFARRRAMRS